MNPPIQITAIVGRQEQPRPGKVSLNVSLQFEQTPENAALFAGEVPAIGPQLIGLSEATFARFKSGEKVTLTIG